MSTQRHPHLMPVLRSMSCAEDARSRNEDATDLLRDPPAGVISRVSGGGYTVNSFTDVRLV
jgi:hypothetical protein